LQGGIPAGNIKEDEDVTANGRTFHVRTFIQYIDDPLPIDGVFPADPIPNDYKSVKVVISWKDSMGQTKNVSSLSRFVPPGLETSAGGAPLAINVSGSDGVGVKQADVHVVNSSVSPVINIVVQTDNNGHLLIPAAPASVGGYSFTISKAGYETVATIDPASVPYIPNYRTQDVLLGQLNSYDYIQNKLSNLTVKTLNITGAPIGSVSFAIKGGKILGRDAANAPILNMENNSESTDATTGEKKYSNISPGNYDITMKPDPQYVLIDYTTPTLQAVLVPAVDLDYTLYYADKDVNALVAKVLDSVDLSPIQGAAVTLSSGGSDIFAAKATSEHGIVFYPDSATPLATGLYDLKVEAPGYTTFTQTGVNIDKLTDVTVNLVKS
jgi:hypothetical protein